MEPVDSVSHHIYFVPESASQRSPSLILPPTITTSLDGPWSELVNGSFTQLSRKWKILFHKESAWQKKRLNLWNLKTANWSVRADFNILTMISSLQLVFNSSSTKLKDLEKLLMTPNPMLPQFISSTMQKKWQNLEKILSLVKLSLLSLPCLLNVQELLRRFYISGLTLGDRKNYPSMLISSRLLELCSEYPNILKLWLVLQTNMVSTSLSSILLSKSVETRLRSKMQTLKNESLRSLTFSMWLLQWALTLILLNLVLEMLPVI